MKFITSSKALMLPQVQQLCVNITKGRVKLLGMQKVSHNLLEPMLNQPLIIRSHLTNGSLQPLLFFTKSLLLDRQGLSISLQLQQISFKALLQVTHLNSMHLLQILNLLLPSCLLLCKPSHFLLHRCKGGFHFVFLFREILILPHPLAKACNPLGKHGCKVASS
ncbi:hypothetical protein HanRHA438_Chr14g0636681 [Helianthus annuus]|nr:hypothetical protein HanIR_Chr14g0678401 [Helianthus annuus]KAJ0852312.1 hypothetical protein HanRHA438_Chr14g0636681 [Helianthus annuus]